MKTSKSFNQEYIEKTKTLIHEILEDKKEYDDWTQICFSMQNAVQAAANIWGTSSDEQINKMRAFITEMVLTELSNTKKFDIVFKKKGVQVERSLDTLYCPKCGSSDVEERAWVNPNTSEIRYNDSIEEEDCWCNSCEEHVMLCTLSELWEMFGEILVNNDDEIESDFMQFKAGTSRFDVWHWFDERCPNNLHDDLMFPNTVNWELYRKNLEDGLANERLWELGCNGDYNPHTENIQVIEKELKLIQYGDYDSILKMHNKEYFEEFREA